MAFAFDQAAHERMSAACDYRDFLKISLEERTRLGWPLSFSELARRAGFAARSFPREILNGTRRLRMDTAEKLAKALGLSPKLTNHLKLLLERDNPDCRPPGRSAERVEYLLKSSTKRLSQNKETAQKGEAIYALNSALRVYAALGTSDYGADLSEIRSRTGLKKENVFEGLKVLLKNDFAVERDGRYYPTDAHLSFRDLGGDRAYINTFLGSLERVRSAVESSPEDKTKLFFHSCLSIPQAQMAELNERLHELLLEFVEKSENPRGDRVATLVCGFAVDSE